MASRALLFDFDGVIADSLHSAADIVRQLIPGLTTEEYRELHEGNVIESIAARTGLSHEARWQFFNTHYSPAVGGFGILPGIADAVHALAANHALFIVSSTRADGIEAYLARHGLREQFKALFGADVHASKTEKIRMIFGEYGFAPEQCLFITDTLGDIREARAAAVDAIAVTWGYHDRELLLKGDPYALVDTTEELLGAVEKYFGPSN